MRIKRSEFELLDALLELVEQGIRWGGRQVGRGVRYALRNR